VSIRMPAASCLAQAAMAIIAFAGLAHGGQDYVSRYDFFAGYAYLNSPHVSLPEHGFHVQAGVRPAPWYSLGLDYSRVSGDLNITPDLLLPSLQQTLGGQLAQLAAAGRLPTGYKLIVPAHSVTQTFAAGPQLAFRRFSSITFFARPALGAIHELATPHAGDAIAAGVVTQLAPSGEKTDWEMFYGFGGGVDIRVSKRLGLRVQADLVRDHLFSDMLKDARNTVRFSIGPCFNAGKNIVKR
jgi:hypothetical protein